MVWIISKRIIPCLDVVENKVVKGKNFKKLRYAGNIIDLARKYYLQGADELVFLDINASYEQRKTRIKTVKDIAKKIFIPFTVGGGIKSVDEIRELLSAGADKISINTSAVTNSELVKESAKQFGSQAIVVAMDVKKINDKWFVFINGGRENTEIDAVEWAKKIERKGAGELLLTSMDSDGTKKGYDLEITSIISKKVNIPVIASGGAGSLKDIYKVLSTGKADSALIASLFHYNKYSIQQVKKYLKKKNLEVRIW